MGSKLVEDHGKVQQELAKLEQKHQAKSEQYAALKVRRQELESEIQTLSTRIGELEVAIPKMEMDVKVRNIFAHWLHTNWKYKQSVTQRQKEIRAGLPVLEQQQAVPAEVNKRIKEIQTTIAGDEKELTKIKSVTDKLQV